MYSLTQAEAEVIDNLMPGNQLLKVGSALKYALDQINDITDSGTDSVKFDNSIVPVYGQDNALISVGTWNTPMVITPSAAYVPLQVNLSNGTNVSGDIAAARFKIATTGAQAATNSNVLELRHTIAHNVNQWATLQCSAAPAAHTITTGEGLVAYFAMDGTGTLTPAGANAIAVMEVINNHTGSGVSAVALFRNNATGFGATSVVEVDNVIGSATNLLSIKRTAGTVTNGIAFTGIMDNAISFAGSLVSTDTDGTLISTGSTWIVHATAGQSAMKLLCSSSAPTGDYETLRLRARSDAANPTGQVCCVGASASANINDYSNLYALRGYAQPNAFTQSVASTIVCGVYSCIDRTGTSVGRSWSLWTDTHETVKSTGGHYLHRLSHNGGAINLDGIWTIYAGQGCDYLMTFENTNAPVTAGDKTAGAKSYSLAVYIDGAVRYIQCYDAV